MWSSTMRPTQGLVAAALLVACTHISSVTAAPTQGTVTAVSSFTIPKPPSGMFHYAAQDLIYIICGTDTNADHYLYVYTTAGAQRCMITIPSSSGMSRVDGFYIKGASAYIVDSQGPIYATRVGALGGSVYTVDWTNPCGCGTSGSCTTSSATWSPTVTATFKLSATASSINDGGGNDQYFRNSGIAVTEDALFAVNGVHPLGGSLSGAYPKSLVKVSLDDSGTASATADSKWSFTASTLGHDVDMEGLACGPDGCKDYIYIGDEYNYVYKLNLNTASPAAAVEYEYNLRSIVGAVRDDKGIESLTYAASTGYFYAGIQDTATVHVISLSNTGSSSSGNGVTTSDPTTSAAPQPLTTKRTSNIFVSDANCDLLDSCSPQDCQVNYESDCVMGKPAVDFQSMLTQAQCDSTCKETSSPKCDAMLATIKEGTGIQAAYCTDEFLVVWSTGKPGTYEPASDAYLGSIPLPPGGGTSCRVRTASELLTVYKIPLTPPVVQQGSNYVANALPGVSGMPAAGAIGMAVDGVPIYPNYNNRGSPAATSCEIDRCNAHSGKGDDYHYHGDPFGSKCLYDSTDMVNLAHPKIIGYALDGFAINGRHDRAGYDGEDVDLDDCGGHQHGDHEYHYHSTVTKDRTATSLDGVGRGTFAYTSYDIAPTKCWKADVSKITNFWDGGQVAYDRSKGNQGPTGWSDYQQIRPCCGAANFLVKQGLGIHGAGSCKEFSCVIGERAFASNSAPATNAPADETTKATTKTPTTKVINTCTTGCNSVRGRRPLKAPSTAAAVPTTTPSPPPSSSGGVSSLVLSGAGAFTDGAAFSTKYTCARNGGGGLSPALDWSAVPAPSGTTEFAVMMYHYPSGATTGTPSTYWLLWNIPASTTSIAAGNPAGIGNVGSDKDGVSTGYTPPCSPGDATHTYYIDVYALSAGTGLGNVDSGAVTHTQFASAISGKTLGTGTISATLTGGTTDTNADTNTDTSMGNTGGACGSGNDDQGKACPANLNRDGLCPRGCTATGTAGGVTNTNTGTVACSGTDDQGRTCPPDLNTDNKCPRGCTQNIFP